MTAQHDLMKQLVSALSEVERGKQVPCKRLLCASFSFRMHNATALPSPTCCTAHRRLLQLLFSVCRRRG